MEAVRYMNSKDMSCVIIGYRSEEPVLTNMDISTGHMVLVSYSTKTHSSDASHFVLQPLI